MLKRSQNFLPDLCSVQSVFALTLVGELLALALVIADGGLRSFTWLKFGMVSISVQWVILASAACICPLRPWFDKKGGVVAGAVSYLIVLFITLVVSVVGHWTQTLHFDVDLYFVIGNLVISSVFAGVLLRYFFIQQQLRNQQQAELHARVQALQSRIRPHFLFNSMNSIASLVHIDPIQAEKMVINLSQLFRASLNEASLVPIESEIELCRKFVSIEQARLGDRLIVQWDIGGLNGKALIPSLLIQPLLENAIYHGIQPMVDGGIVKIMIKSDGHQVHLSINNPYAAKDEMEKTSQMDNNNGMALDNIRNRLSAYFGVKAKMHINRENSVFNVDLSYPLLTEIETNLNQGAS